MTTWVTICDTCKREGWENGPQERTDGAALADRIEAMPRAEAIVVRRVSCLMGCTHGCNVAIQAAGKLCYTIGRFEPTDEAARAILDYAALHAESSTGQVPYRQWPQGVKGHFVTRHPPLPDAEDAA